MLEGKKLKTIFMSALLMMTLNLSAFSLHQGWNLISLPYNSTFLGSLQNTENNVTSVWTYKGKWQAFSPRADISKLFVDNNISLLKKITPSDGVWVQLDGNYTSTFAATPAYTNEMNITKGWNLLGTIESVTSLYAIDSKAIFWKYKNGEWLLGDNKSAEGLKKFSTISSDEGFWVYSDRAYKYKENRNKQILFVDENLMPQSGVVVDPNAGLASDIDGVVDVHPFLNTLNIQDPRFHPINNLKLDYSDRVPVVFLEESGLKIIGEENSSSELVVTDFTLPDYFESFYPVAFFPVEAKVVPPLISGLDVSVLVVNKDMKQSLTLFLNKMSTSPQNLPVGKFIKGFDMQVRDVHASLIPLEKLNGQANLKPAFSNVEGVTHPYVYAKNGESWDFVGPAFQRGSTFVSKNWYDKFTSFVLVDVNESNFYTSKRQVFNENGQVLRDVVVLSDAKISASSDYNGTFHYAAPSKPKKLIAFKQGYLPQLLDTNASDTIVLKKMLQVADVAGLHSQLDENFVPTYVIGTKRAHFTYVGDDYTLKPELLAETNKTIYSSVYPYNDGLAFAASDSTVEMLTSDKHLKKLREGDGLIYDTFYVKNNTVYYGTFGDTFGTIQSDGTISIDNALSDFSFLNFALATIYKPLISDTKIYIPLYNQDASTKASLYIKGRLESATNNLAMLSNLGTPGKLTQTAQSVIFGTSSSQIIFVDKESNSVTKQIDFNGSGIIAKEVTLNDTIFAVDLNGTVKKFSSAGEELASLHLSPASNLLINTDELLVGAFDGKMYHLDTNLHILKTEQLDSAIIAEPIIYNGNIYTITTSGNFYKNSTLIGTFATKVTNITLANGILLFAGENGSIWKIVL